MLDKTFPRKLIFLCAGILIVASVVTAAVLTARRQRPNPQKPQKRVVQLPEVVSHVPKLRIVNIDVKNPGTPQASAVVEILNTSNLPVMAVEISTKNQAGDSGAVNSDGLDDPDNPQVVIPPFGTTKLEMNFSEMVPDAPLALSGAVFGDGSEEGDRWSLETMRIFRNKRQQSLRAEREKQKGGVKP